ncbi:transposase family protein [Streptomyces sp. Qhu_M48]|uniref:transposase family protein n=1 Tax=Streptomyces sp. Qhu_M48 TaxID=3435889 RepID=UPI003F4FC450
MVIPLITPATEGALLDPYPATLDVSHELVEHVAWLLYEHRQARNTRWPKLDCFQQALLTLVHLRKNETFSQLGAGFGISQATAWRYVDEALDVLAGWAPGLHEALTGLGESDHAADPHTRGPCLPGRRRHFSHPALRKVRHTILRLIGDHYRRPQGTRRSWQGCDLDLTGVTIDFTGATFSNGTVTFNDAVFSDGAVAFGSAIFSGGEVFFNGATFSGGRVSFFGAVFSGGTVSFHNATFSGGTVSFSRAAFTGRTVSFSDATGTRPRGLLAAVGTPVPATVDLPEIWLS